MILSPIKLDRMDLNLDSGQAAQVLVITAGMAVGYRLPLLILLESKDLITLMTPMEMLKHAVALQLIEAATQRLPTM